MRDRIVGVGEVLWDVFPDGPRFGGAPANFACHASGLGAEVALLSAVGPKSERLAIQALQELAQRAVSTKYVQHSSYETGCVFVEVDEQGQPTYRFSEHPAWDVIDWQDELSQLAKQADVVCFGTLAQRNPHSRRTVQRFMEAARPDAWRIFDVNLRVDYWSNEVILDSLRRANVLKLNDGELPIVAQAAALKTLKNPVFQPQDREITETLRQLIKEFGLSVIALTCGSRGALLVTEEDQSWREAPRVTVKDTVGAGDAFTAALALGLRKQWSLDEINHRATDIAGYVCTQSGATPQLPAELIKPFVSP